MTILSVCQDAAKLIKPAQSAPASIFSSTDPFAIELATLANEGAVAIFKAHDWQKQLTLKTQAGDGSTTAFDFPSDYDRMPIEAGVFLASTGLPMIPVYDLDVWLDHRLRTFSTPNGEWMILGGQLSVYPAVASTDSVKYYYLSNKIVTADGGTTKATFTADSDTFRLPERLIKLDLIWRWRHRKGLAYAEDLQNFEIAKAQEIKNDKGSRVMHVGRARLPAADVPTFPGTINA